MAWRRRRRFATAKPSTVTATQPDSAVSGALCATDLAGEGRSGDLAMGLCAPRLGDLSSGSGVLAVELCAPRLSIPIPGRELVPLVSDSFDAASAPGFRSASGSTLAAATVSGALCAADMQPDQVRPDTTRPPGDTLGGTIITLEDSLAQLLEEEVLNPMVLLRNHLEEQEKLRAALEHERAVNANLLLEFQKPMTDQALQPASFITSLREGKSEK